MHWLERVATRKGKSRKTILSHRDTSNPISLQNDHLRRTSNKTFECTYYHCSSYFFKKMQFRELVVSALTFLSYSLSNKVWALPSATWVGWWREREDRERVGYVHHSISLEEPNNSLSSFLIKNARITQF